MNFTFNKNNVLKYCAAGGIVAVALAGTLALSKAVAVNAPNAPFGKVDIEVYDGNTNEPIEGARVVVVETGDELSTSKSGSTGVVDLPIITDKRYENKLSKPWGEVTLLCFKDGYVPYALFYAQVWEGQARKGPRLYLFAEDGEETSPFSIVEGPQRLWVNDLIAKYEK